MRVTAICALLAGLTVPAAAAHADPAVAGYPNSIAAAGDSITQAYDADSAFPPGERPQYSWATGTSSQVNSVYARILAANPAIAGNAFNDSVTGANMVDLPGQVANAVAQHAQLVVVEMGANDVCTSTPATMTSVADFKTQLQSSMKALSKGLPDARIEVFSIPSVYRLWQVLKDTGGARLAWSLFSICPSMLANPLSTAQADVDRRAAVLQREVGFNTTLRKTCARYIHCHFDGSAVFNYPFAVADADTLDYFHPSIGGQAKLAQTAFDVGFDFTDSTPPVSTAQITPIDSGDVVSITASDDVGVAGIEYRLGKGHWVRYKRPVIVGPGRTITWRAVDVNGNCEATLSLTI